jgi:ketosteroid isomerase-like protein
MGTRGARIAGAIALIWAAFIASGCQRQDATESTAIAPEVLQAQSRRFQATIDVDIETLGDLLADDLSYTHSTGQIDTKAEFLDSLQAQTIKYLSIEPQDMQVRLYGDFAVITGITALRVHFGGQDRAASLRITEVHRRHDNGWQLLAYQSTRIPEE